jgi:GTP-binding protein
MSSTPYDIRNVAIIAHVDHGKTTLVDWMLKQTNTFRDNQAEMTQTTILDSNDLEREKGITILAKTTGVWYQNTKINIIDTPGHADFAGEVERVLGMADGAILLVDAAEGPLPQTTFVLKQALKLGLKVIVVVNKIDKPIADPARTLSQVEDLFLNHAESEAALHFPVLYAIGMQGKIWDHLPSAEEQAADTDLKVLFETVTREIPSARADDDAPAQLLISTLESDPHLGRICMGRLHRGTLTQGQEATLVNQDGTTAGKYRVEKLFTTMGLNREATQVIHSGEIAAVAGMKELTIGMTLCDSRDLTPLPAPSLTPPTLKITIGPNTSPMAGREGSFLTSRQIFERLLKEKETNIGLHINPAPNGLGFEVAGRGELHLAVLIETLRREGYELEVSRPVVIYQEINGVKHEPYSEVTVDVLDEHTGAVNTEFSKRRGMLKEMRSLGTGETRLIFEISDHNFLGTRSILLTQTRGSAQLSVLSLGYRPVGGDYQNLRNGVLVSSDTGKASGYGLENAQERGMLFVGVGDEVYPGMIIGLNSRDQDMRVNVAKVKKSTNVRAASKDMGVQLTPPTRYSLEQCLDFLADDELLEVVTSTLRLRKRDLKATY